MIKKNIYRKGKILIHLILVANLENAGILIVIEFHCDRLIPIDRVIPTAIGSDRVIGTDCSITMMAIARLRQYFIF
jgi:hypothetical protein